jgi:hypothetical protein
MHFAEQLNLWECHAARNFRSVFAVISSQALSILHTFINIRRKQERFVTYPQNDKIHKLNPFPHHVIMMTFQMK